MAKMIPFRIDSDTFARMPAALQKECAEFNAALAEHDATPAQLDAAEAALVDNCEEIEDFPAAVAAHADARLDFLRLGVTLSGARLQLVQALNAAHSELLRQAIANEEAAVQKIITAGRAAGLDEDAIAPYGSAVVIAAAEATRIARGNGGLDTVEYAAEVHRKLSMHLRRTVQAFVRRELDGIKLSIG
jgi:predicted transcriptional regulator